MNGYIPYGQTQPYQGTQYFPQPQGNVYLVNNSLEVANVPMGAGLSMVLCPSEGTMYLKTLQGGAPTLIVYSIAPYEQKAEEAPTRDYGAEIAELKAQIEALSKEVVSVNFSNPLQALMMMGQTQSMGANPLQQMMGMGMPQKQPIDPNRFSHAAGKLDKQALANLVTQARQQGISEEEIEAGLNFLLKLR